MALGFNFKNIPKELNFVFKIFEVVAIDGDTGINTKICYKLGFDPEKDCELFPTCLKLFFILLVIRQRVDFHRNFGHHGKNRCQTHQQRFVEKRVFFF